MDLSLEDLKPFVLPFGVVPEDATRLCLRPSGARYAVSADGERYWLRLSHGGEPGPFEREASLLDHLHAWHFPAPRLVRTRAGAPFHVHEGTVAALAHAVPGEVRPAAALGFEALERLGEELGKLHRDAQHFSGRFPALDLHQPHAALPLTESPERQIAHAAAALLAKLSIPEVGLLPEGPLHRGLAPTEVRWVGDRVTGICGFDRVCFGPYVAEVGLALSAFVFEAHDDPALGRALLMGYLRSHRLSPAEREALPGFFRWSLLARALERLPLLVRDPGLAEQASERALRLADRAPALAAEVLP